MRTRRLWDANGAISLALLALLLSGYIGLVYVLVVVAAILLTGGAANFRVPFQLSL